MRNSQSLLHTIAAFFAAGLAYCTVLQAERVSFSASSKILRLFHAVSAGSCRRSCWPAQAGALRLMQALLRKRQLVRE
jgi:HAMP domain-containing protein